MISGTARRSSSRAAEVFKTDGSGDDERTGRDGDEGGESSGVTEQLCSGRELDLTTYDGAEAHQDGNDTGDGCDDGEHDNFQFPDILNCSPA